MPPWWFHKITLAIEDRIRFPVVTFWKFTAKHFYVSLSSHLSASLLRKVAQSSDATNSCEAQMIHLLISCIYKLIASMSYLVPSVVRISNGAWSLLMFLLATRIGLFRSFILDSYLTALCQTSLPLYQAKLFVWGVWQFQAAKKRVEFNQRWENSSMDLLFFLTL